MADAGPADQMVASFARPEEATAAMAKLERSGVPASGVTLVNEIGGPSAGTGQRADERKMQWFGRTFMLGAILGAVVLAIVVGVGVAVLWDGEPIGAVVGAAIGGAVAGAFVGGFIGVGISMPRNPQAWDTYLLEHGGEVCISVDLRGRSDAVSLAELLRQEGATSVERLGGPPPRTTG
jgi:hypothetical protein